MKLRSLVSLLTTSVLAAGSMVVSSNLVQANTGYRFVCQQKSSGTWTTFVIRPDGTQSEFINWRSDAFTLAGYSPEVRCQQVMGRMNKYIAKGTGQKITHGTMNNQPVLCLTDQKGGDCQGLLYTLKPGQPAEETLRDLLELNRRNFKGTALNEGPGCRTYVDINAMLTGQLQRAEVVCKAR